ncbi:MAG TPA: LCP family protein [bacterium]|nr:LCP family protein [bacterium]
MHVGIDRIRTSMRTFLAAAIAMALVSLVIFSAPPTGPLVSQTPEARPPMSAAVVPRGDVRFLVVGLTQDRERTDTVEVVQWDDSHHRVRVLGVPRDIPISLPGVQTTKLDHAYATGGIGRARAAVVRLLNVPIAHYVVFSLPAMRQIVDLIGGVPIDVEKRMVYADHEQGLFIDLYPGPQVLDGAHAEQYLRFRHDPEGDIGRIRRQQHFIQAALVQVHKPAVIVRLPRIIETARGDILTDLTTSEILGWMQRVQPLTPDEVTAASIEGQPAVLYDDLARMRLDFWVPDPRDLRAKTRWLISGVPPSQGNGSAVDRQAPAGPARSTSGKKSVRGSSHADP